jgi:WD40 repeat protein/tetratricopeptide (TPR) repeat protein
MPIAREPDKLKVFISYSRRNSVEADALVSALMGRGFDVTIDRRDLPFGEKWQTELAEFIRLSDTVIWLVSEASIRSTWVNWELDEVAKRNKRLVPVIVGDVERETLPRQLGEIHILPAEGAFALERDLDALVRVLETDRAWLKHATRLQDRAAEWIASGRTSALLLSRGALSDAERWKDARPAKAPVPAKEVLDLLLASRQGATKRLRWWVGGSLTVAAGALALAIVAYLQSVEATRQRDVAQSQARSSTLFSSALQHENQDPTFGLRLLGHARKAFASTTIATAGADWYRSKQFYKLALFHHEALAVAFVPPANGLISASEESVKAWSLDGAMKWELAASLPIAIRPDGKQLVAITKRYGGIFITIDAETGKPLAAVRQLGDATALNAVTTMRFSRDGRHLAVGYADGTLKILDWEAASVRSFAAHRPESPARVNSIDFSPDGQKLATSGDGTLVHIWDLNGNLVRTLTGHQDIVGDVAFSPDGKLILSRSDDMTTRTWSVEGPQVGQVRSSGGNGRIGMFANSRHAFLSVLDGNTLVLWDDEGKALQQFTAPGSILGVDRSPDGEFIVTVHRSTRELPQGEGTIRLWRLQGVNSFSRADGDGCVNKIALSADGRSVVTGPHTNCVSTNGTSFAMGGYESGYIRIVDRRSGTDLKIDVVDSDRRVAISRDGQLIGACGDKALFFKRDGTPLRTFDDAECPIALGPTSRHALITMLEGAVLWDLEKDKRRPLGSQISNALFSPRGDSVLLLTIEGRVEHWGLDGTALPVPETGHRVRRIGFSADGAQALALDTSLRLWPVDAPDKVRSIHIGTERTVEILSLPARNVIVTLELDRIDVWTQQGEPVASYRTIDNGILALVPAPQGTAVLAATSARTIMEVLVPLPLAHFEKSSELAEFSALRYALAGVDDQYQALLASKDHNGLIAGFNEFTDRAWALGDREILQKALTLGEQVIRQQMHIASAAEVLAIASDLDVENKIDRLMSALEPRHLLEIVELLDKENQGGMENRRARAYKRVSDAVDSIAARKNLPEFKGRVIRARQAPFLREAERLEARADEASSGPFVAQADNLYQKAIEAYRAALALDPSRASQTESSPDVQLSLAKTFLSKGYANFRNRKYAEAKSDWGEAIALGPDTFSEYSNFGLVEFELSNFTRALANFDKAIAADGGQNEPAPLCGKAIALHQLGQTEAAVQWFAKCIALSDEYASAEGLTAFGWTERQVGTARQILKQLQK